MASTEQEIRAAAARYGRSVNHIAAQYVDPVTGHRLSGEALLIKLSKLESNFNMDAVSPAQARGATQFVPGSRRVAIEKFGVDPWRTPDEAVHAAALHLRGKINGRSGLAGYNPGDAA